MVVRRPASGRRTVVGGDHMSSAAPKKNHFNDLIEAAPFGRLDQMLRTTERRKKKAFDRGGPVWPPRSNAADDRLGWVCKAPPAKIRGEMVFFPNLFEKKFEKNPFHL